MADHPQSEKASAAGVAGYLIGPAFLVLAAAMVLGPMGAEVPEASSPAISPALIKTDPVRTMLGDPPVSVVNGQDRRCNDCHSIFESRDGSQGNLQQHQEIHLVHGLNNDCYNCHDADDRERLTLRGGETVGYAESAMLCAQCHGRVYRDWTRGTHGKTVGAWDRHAEAFDRLSCVECHDPHSPMFAGMSPLPAPNTLRMGDPGSSHHHGVQAERNPLLMWSEPHADDHREDEHHGEEHGE